jgi:hypothetical protein
LHETNLLFHVTCSRLMRSRCAVCLQTLHDTASMVTKGMSESESESLYDWQFTSNQFVSATNPVRPTTGIFIFQLNTCGYSPYVVSSLKGGCVCHLKLLLVLASAVVLRSESRGTHGHIYCLRFETPPTWKASYPYLYPPGIWWPGYTPRHWVPFSSPPATHRATARRICEVLGAHMWCKPNWRRSKLKLWDVTSYRLALN